MTLTEMARAQAGPDAEQIVALAQDMVDRRDLHWWPAATDFELQVLRGSGGDYEMYPVAVETIEVDSCVWEEIGLPDVHESHRLHGKNLKLPSKAGSSR